MLRFLLLPLFLAAATCGSERIDDLPEVRLYERFQLVPGDSVRVVDAMTEVTEGVLVFEEVVEDSRCPVDATCVWEGEATIALTFHAANRQTHPARLTIVGERHEGVEREEADRADVGEFVTFLLRLDPYPGTEDEPQATLLLERLGR